MAVRAIQTLKLPARYRIPYIMADCRLGDKQLTVSDGTVLNSPEQSAFPWPGLGRFLLFESTQLQNQFHDQSLDPVATPARTFVVHDDRVRHLPFAHGAAAHRRQGETAHVEYEVEFCAVQILQILGNLPA